LEKNVYINSFPTEFIVVSRFVACHIQNLKELTGLAPNRLTAFNQGQLLNKECPIELHRSPALKSTRTILNRKRIEGQRGAKDIGVSYHLRNRNYCVVLQRDFIIVRRHVQISFKISMCLFSDYELRYN